MSTHTRTSAALGLAAVLAVFVLVCAQALATEMVAPLPPSAYTTRADCPPAKAGRATCLSLRLLAKTAQARAHVNPLGVIRASARATPSVAGGDFGLTPQEIHSAYGLPTSATGAQTIALVDAYNDLNAQADLETYDTEFGLPTCTKANGCFKQVNENGETADLPFPETETSLTDEEALCEEEQEEACILVEEAQGWSVEISLDIETAHATCQSCHIVLVEADSPSYIDLEAAEDTAVALGAVEVSNSWGGPECSEGAGCVGDSAAFNHPGVVITASAGDDGYLNWLEEPRTSYASFPAASPHVVAVGGTRLILGTHGERVKESIWNDGGESAGHKDGFGAGGGGCSAQFTAPAWQQKVSDWSKVGCAGKRAVSDVSADADPYTGLAVYDSSPECETAYEEGGVEHAVHWCTIGGTSLASPLIASVFALAGGAQGVEYPAETLYENLAQSAASLHDVTEGSNGECLLPFDEQTGAQGCTAAQDAKTSCASKLICLASVGYDGPSGVGTPNGIAAFQPPTEGAGGESGGQEEGEEEPQGPGKPPGGPGEQGAGGTGGSSSGAGAQPSSPTGGSGGSSTPGPTATAATSVRVTGLALTLRALIALNSNRPKLAKLAFTFTISVSARVRVALERQVRMHGHTRWRAQIRPFTIAALGGRNSRGVGGHGVLSPGSYRLTLTPERGTARSLAFRIG